MTTDWTAVERDYLAGGVTYGALAEKYGVCTSSVAHHASRGGWKALRAARTRRDAPDGEDPAGECGAIGREDAPAPDGEDRAGDCGAARAVDGASLRSKLLALADNWTEAQAGHIEDVGDYRRVVQSVLDLTRAESENDVPAVRVVMDVPAEYGE